MKIWTVISGVLSTLLVASILTFGLSTEIASAHGPGCEKHHKKDDGCPSPGGGGGDKDVATFDVDLLGPVMGGSDPDWLRGSSRLVGQSDPHFPAGPLNLAVFLSDFFGDSAKNNCFGATDSIKHGHVRQIKHGTAEVVLLMDGKTRDGVDDVVYRLLMKSVPGAIPDNWLPIKGSPETIDLTDWEVTVAGSQPPELEPRSCAGSGLFGATFTQSVTVTQTD